MVVAKYHSFRDVFSKEAFDKLRLLNAWEHAIDLTPGTELPCSWTFPLSPAEQKELDNFLWENLANGHIHPSKSPMGAPVFFIKKKDGSLCLIQDYQKLNEIMVKNSYPLPLVSDVLTHLHGAEFFTILDLHWGFNNVQIKEGDEWKAAFQTNQGLFKPTIMFFRLCNSPAMFQTMMNDILVYSCTLSDHWWIVCQVLSTLWEWRLFLKPEKCKFEQKEVEYLRLVISKDNVPMDLMKVCGVMEWPTPMKVKEVQSFLGFMNFYWKFICDFSDIACPLYTLTCKTQQWVWGSAEQEAFNALKGAVTSAPVLTFLSQNGCFCLKCNASDFATGAVLSQVQADGMHQPIAFMSKGFSDVEHNYQIHDKEMLAIMCALDKWCHFLEGVTEKFKILMDHQNLAYFQDPQKLNCWQAHWSLFLSCFDFSLCHQPGWLMGRPDTLSQRSNHPHGKDDNANITLLPSDVFKVCNMEATLVDSGGDKLVECIWRSMDYNDAVVKALQELGAGMLQLDKWERDGDLVMYRGCVYVPKDPQLCHNIVHAHHDSMMTGHPGQWKTLELVSHNYWWLGISCYVANYVAGCDACNCCRCLDLCLCE